MVLGTRLLSVNIGQRLTKRKPGEAMFAAIKLRRGAAVAVLLLLLSVFAASAFALEYGETASPPAEKNFIRWVDFSIPPTLMEQAIRLDTESAQNPAEPHVDWVELLAYLGAKYGGDFSRYRTADLNALLEQTADGKSIAELGASMPYYDYYIQAYQAVLGGFVGEYEVKTETGWEKKYGLKAFSPIAKTFPYSDYDDFGAGRSYGYRRKHLGHDLMAQTGTPVVAVESGVVEVMGWNQFGGWRIGVRSFDGKRYHYYAHLRKDRPYAAGLEQGQVVMAGDVIGYVGRTGYSTTENTNNIDESHLHYGIQLIFDESQKEGNNEIWIDVYGICSLLQKNRSETVRDDATKEWSRTDAFRETIPQDCFTP